MTGWLRCDAMLSLNRRQRELVESLIGGQLNSDKIAAKVGCTENTVKLIRAERHRERAAERRRDAYELEVAARPPKVAKDSGEWPKVDGDFLADLKAAHPPGLFEPRPEYLELFERIVLCGRPVDRIRFGDALS